MLDSRNRAEVSSRITAPDAWDAGLHAESEAGPIDVGLCVEPRAVGLMIDAPGIGRLKVAFDVSADGTTRLSRATRNATVIAVDEARVLQLEGELDRLRRTSTAVQSQLDAQVGHLTTERDEARDRAAILSEEGKELALVAREAEQGLSSASAALQVERDARLATLAEREKARAELDRFREELEGGSATLARELAESRVARDAAAQALEVMRARLADLEAQVAEAKEETETRDLALGTERDERQRLETALASVRAELGASAPAADLEAARATVGALEAELTTAREALASAVPATELDAARAQLAASVPATELEAAQQAIAALEAALASAAPATELDAAQAQLSAAMAATATLEAELATAREALNAAVSAETFEAIRAHAAALEAQLAASVPASEFETAQGTIASLEAALAAAGAPGEADAARARLTSLQAELASREESVSMAVARGDALQAELAASEERLNAEAVATREAREIALKLKTQSDKLLLERDEARAVARQLHQKMAGTRSGEALTDPMTPKTKGP